MNIGFLSTTENKKSTGLRNLGSPISNALFVMSDTRTKTFCQMHFCRFGDVYHDRPAHDTRGRCRLVPPPVVIDSCFENWRLDNGWWARISGRTYVRYRGTGVVEIIGATMCWRRVESDSQKCFRLKTISNFRALKWTRLRISSSKSKKIVCGFVTSADNLKR